MLSLLLRIGELWAGGFGGLGRSDWSTRSCRDGGCRGETGEPAREQRSAVGARLGPAFDWRAEPVQGGDPVGTPHPTPRRSLCVVGGSVAASWEF